MSMLIRLPPAYMKEGTVRRYISKDTSINCGQGIIRELLGKIPADGFKGGMPVRQIRFVPGIPENMKEKVVQETGAAFTDSEEGYIMEVREDITVYASTDRGLFYGCMSLLQQYGGQGITERLVYEHPVCPVRGIKIYLPAPEDIAFFKKLIDMICFYKYNTVVIEVGGAMEYRKHPEINSGWVKYCSEMNSRSDRAREIQEHTFGWKKNSIHAENGGGRYLSRETVQSLVSYCRERFLEVVPEMPSLSHCDYLLINHPELRERAEDPYPDTYCPGNPASYDLYFDLLDEVIEVFRPSILHIGHDEYYSIGLCDQCKEKKAEEIYADDIGKIHGYLKDRGIRTMIWGDKLLDAYCHGYGQCGGAERDMHHPVTGEYTGTIPATYKALELIPEDIMILHWYWSLDKNYEDRLLDRGLETVYGNFYGMEFPEWTKRLEKGIRGAVISNWSALKKENLQRNGFFFNLVYTGIMFWNPCIYSLGYDYARDMALQETFAYQVLNYREGEESPAGVTKGAWLELLLTTDYRTEYTEFVDGTFIDVEGSTLGSCILTYRDGTEKEIPIIYGSNISSLDVSEERKLDVTGMHYEIDRRLPEAAFSTCPARYEGRMWYRYIVENPYTASDLNGIRIVSKKPGSRILFASAAVTGHIECSSGIGRLL